MVGGAVTALIGFLTTMLIATSEEPIVLAWTVFVVVWLGWVLLGGKAGAANRLGLLSQLLRAWSGTN